MSQRMKPLVTVAGALSKQGRSVVNTLLQSQKFRVRALTRQIDAPVAQAFAQAGAELLNIPLELGHKDDFIRAFEGSHAVFLMTPPIAPPATHETELGIQLADAAVEAGVQHIIFSSLENVDQITDGKKFAPHFTDKARVEEYIRTLPVISSFIYLAFFYTNFLEYYPPHFEGDTLIFPIYLPKDFQAPFVDPLTATGPAVLEILSHPNQYSGQSLPVIGEIMSSREMVETFTKVTGIKAEYRSAFSYQGLVHNFPELGENDLQVREILGMAEYAVEYGYYRQDRDLLWSRRINPNGLTWGQFLKETNWDGTARSFGVQIS